MRVEDITSLHVGYARAHMDKGATPLPPIKPKRVASVSVSPADKAPPVVLSSDAHERSQAHSQASISLPVAAAAPAATLQAVPLAPAAPETIVIEKTVPVVDTPFIELVTIERGDTAAQALPTAANPRSKSPLRARYVALAAAVGASVAVIFYQGGTTPAHAGMHETTVVVAQSQKPKATVAPPVVSTQSQKVVAKDDSTPPSDKVAAREPFMPIDAAPAKPVGVSVQQPSSGFAPPASVAAQPLTALDLMPDSPRPNFVRPSTGLAHVSAQDFTAHRSPSLDSQTRVVLVQADGGNDAVSGSPYEAPIRKVIRSLHSGGPAPRRTAAKTPTTTTVAAASPAGASAGAAPRPGAVQTDANGDQRLF